MNHHMWWNTNLSKNSIEQILVNVSSLSQVEVARPKWPLIKRVSSAHMFPVLSIYMVWKKTSSALSSGQWSRTCLIRGHFGLGRSDQRQFRTHTSLIRGGFRAHFSLIRERFDRTFVWSERRFERIFVWSEDVSSAHLSDSRTFWAHNFLIRGCFES